MLTTLSAFPVPDDIQKQWQLDMRINATGVRLDLGLIVGAIKCNDIITDELMNEAIKLTGLQNPKSVAQLKKWLEDETGEEINSLSKANVQELKEKQSAKRMLIGFCLYGRSLVNLLLLNTGQ